MLGIFFRFICATELPGIQINRTVQTNIQEQTTVNKTTRTSYPSPVPSYVSQSYQKPVYAPAPPPPPSPPAAYSPPGVAYTGPPKESVYSVPLPPQGVYSSGAPSAYPSNPAPYTLGQPSSYSTVDLSYANSQPSTSYQSPGYAAPAPPAYAPACPVAEPQVIYKCSYASAPTL